MKSDYITKWGRCYYYFLITLSSDFLIDDELFFYIIIKYSVVVQFGYKWTEVAAAAAVAVAAEAAGRAKDN